MLTCCCLAVGQRVILHMQHLALLRLTDVENCAENAQGRCKSIDDDSDHELLFECLLEQQEILLADELLQLLIAVQQTLYLSRRQPLVRRDYAGSFPAAASRRSSA